MYLAILVIVIILIVALIANSLTKTAGSIVDKFLNMSFASGETGNSIGNIRNYGYAAENGGWIYYLSPNEDSTEIGIFKIKNNGTDKKQLFMSEMDIVSINVYDGYVYFISGMALGFDMICAEIVLELKMKYPYIKLICAIPCKNQDKLWNDDCKKRYKKGEGKTGRGDTVFRPWRKV